MHENIKRFFLVGTIYDDDNIVTRKQELISELEVVIRDNEHVPVLDLEPQFTREYQVDEEAYMFRLTIYGVKEKDSWNVAGISNGTILKSSTLSRSNLSLSI